MTPERSSCNPLSHGWVLALIMVAAIAVRGHELTQPIVRFHPTRHYRSAVLARACYYDRASGIPGWARAVANASREMQPAGEPPIMEWLACGAYLAMGHENITVPRALAAIVWVSGAIPLWWLAGRFASPAGALLAAAMYLFLPYGIVASRNFQPDPLMTVAALWAIVALVRHRGAPSNRRFVVAAILVAAAGVIKPMSVFLTVPALVALTPSWRGAWLLAAGLAPPAVYYGYGAVAGTLVQDQMRLRFAPRLLTTSFFWNGLATQASRVETLPLLAAAIAGAVAARDALAGRLLAALFAGYAAFAVAFTYHMPTHDYYHLPYIAVVALGVGVLVARMERMVSPTARTTGAVALCVLIAAVGTVRAWPRLEVADADAYGRMYEEIGALASHSPRVLFLDTEYGYALMYHAQVSGDAWPNRDDLVAEAIDGRLPIDATARYERDYADWGPEYFIVTDLESFGASADLQRLLDRRATPVRLTERYRVYKFLTP